MRWGGVSEYAIHDQDRSGGRRWSRILVKHKNTNQRERIYKKTNCAKRRKPHADIPEAASASERFLVLFARWGWSS